MLSAGLRYLALFSSKEETAFYLGQGWGHDSCLWQEASFLIISVWLGNVEELAWLNDGLITFDGNLESYILSLTLSFFTFPNSRMLNSSDWIYLIAIRARWGLVKQAENTCVWEADTKIISHFCWLERENHNYHVFEPILTLSNFLKKLDPC